MIRAKFSEVPMKRIAIVGAGKIGHMIADLLGGCGDYQVADR